MAAAEAGRHPRRVHLVAASAAEIGGGHVSRAIALAHALIGRGVEVSTTFLGGEPRGEAAREAAGLGLRDVPIPDDTLVVADLPDADAAIGLAAADRLVVFDDRDAFTGSARIVVQPSLPRWAGPGHADRVLAGYAFVPLSGRYRAIRDGQAGSPRRPRSALPRVVLCFGGSDPAGVTERLAPALAVRAAGSAPAWSLEVIVGAGHAGSAGGGESALFPIVRDPPDLPERLAAADLAIVAAGTMKFEVACLGRPAILVGVADDQIRVGPAFAATGAADWLGDGRTLDPARLADAVAELVGDPARRKAMGLRGAAELDGRGADRLAAAILETDEG